MSREPTLITSLQNDRVKLIRSLDMRKARRETGLFVAEGTSILVTAREYGHAPRILVTQAWAEHGEIGRGLIDWAQDAGADVLAASPAVMQKLAAKENPQAMMGVFEQRWAQWGQLGSDPAPRTVRSSREGGVAGSDPNSEADAVRLGSDPASRTVQSSREGGVAGSDPNTDPNTDVWLALEEIRDPGNLGTIVRTVDAVGAKGVILVGPCCDPYSHECVRATMGSVFAVPLVRMDRGAYLDLAKAWAGDVVGTHLDAREDFRLAKPRGPVLLVMGSEGPGMGEDVRAACTRLVRIPMAGRLDSLNLAVATALTLYQLRGAHLRIS